MTAGLTLNLFNYLYLYFRTDLDTSKKSARSSILKELENEVRDRQFDFNLNELVNDNPLPGQHVPTRLSGEPKEQPEMTSHLENNNEP
jgi:hypothetical protein